MLVDGREACSPRRVGRPSPCARAPNLYSMVRAIKSNPAKSLNCQIKLARVRRWVRGRSTLKGSGATEITGGMVRSVYRASYPMGGRPSVGELEALRGELEVTASRLASGLCEWEVYRLFMDEVKELLFAEGVDP